MLDAPFTPATPQFEQAEYAEKPDTERCALCHASVGDTYYRVSNAMACAACAEKAKGNQIPDSHAAFARGLVFGAGGAMVGVILYATFAIVTGLVIGYVSLAVGYIVGKAMKAGSRGRGGRRYQVAAALLTYAAVSVAAVPVAISQQIKAGKIHAPAAAHSQGGSEQSPAAPARQNPPQPPEKHMSIAAAMGVLLLIGLASPFLELQDPFHGIIGLVILLVGIRIAWRITDGSPSVDVLGPFRNRAQAAVEPGTG
jgi:hypothetical protein